MVNAFPLFHVAGVVCVWVVHPAGRWGDRVAGLTWHAQQGFCGSLLGRCEATLGHPARRRAHGHHNPSQFTCGQEPTPECARPTHGRLAATGGSCRWL